MKALAALMTGSALGFLTSLQVLAADDLVIGMAVAKSGWMNAYDDDPTKAAEIAVDDINAKGGVLHRKLKLVYSDTKSDAAQAFKAGQEVLAEKAEFVVASCDFDVGSPVALAAQQAGVATMSICSGSPKWGPQGVGPTVFTISIAAQVEGYIVAEWAFKKQGYKTAYMLKDTWITYTRSMCQGFEERWKELAGEQGWLGLDTFRNEDPSIAAQITRLKGLPKQPDAIFICTVVPGGASAIRQLRNAGVNQPILGGFGLDGAYWLDSVPNLSNFYLPVHVSVFGDDPRPEVQSLIKRFTERFGKPPATGYFAMGYSVIQAFGRAADRAGKTHGAAIAAELEKFRDEPLLIGPRTFTKDLHIQTTAQGLMMQVQNGKHSTLGYFVKNEKPVPFESLFKD
jgi:branched-chain amino acid transport system substrate-binding protein